MKHHMTLYAPKYYLDFKCTADKCTHSCCVGWEIDVDSASLEKYKSVEHSYGEKILNSIDYSDTPHFMLCQGERCPHLNGQGLCSIITHLGDEYLCDICREHPRFYNDTCRGKEVGLGMACEEACRIILNSDDYYNFVEIGEVEGELKQSDVNSLIYRQHIYRLLSSCSLSYEERLGLIYKEYNISPLIFENDKWTELLCKLEYLDEKHKNLFLSCTFDMKTEKELEKPLERALAYFVYRHCTDVYDEEDFCASLGFCLFCERLLCSVARILGDVELAARIISEELEYSLDNTEEIMRQFI